MVPKTSDAHTVKFPLEQTKYPLKRVNMPPERLMGGEEGRRFIKKILNHGGRVKKVAGRG